MLSDSLKTLICLIVLLIHLDCRGQEHTVSHDDFFFISIPKCGTHLMSSCISMLVEKPVDEGYDWISPNDFNNKYKKRFKNTLSTAKKNHYIHKTHVPWFKEIERFFTKTKYKWLFQIRDPRDAVISLVFYIEKLKHLGNKRDFFWVDSSVYDSLSLEEKITAVITGSCCSNYLTSRFCQQIPWAYSSNCLVIRFEDLIGQAGEGSLERQLETICTIAKYLSLDLTQEKTLKIIENLYCPWSYSEIEGKEYIGGRIGSWKRFFTDDHKKIFKEILGKELIRLGYEKNLNW